MSFTVDQILDRRLLRGKLTFWRVAAFVALALAVVALAWRASGAGGGLSGPHIARVSIEGVITGDRDTLKLIDDVAKSSASAVLLSIESPGGTTTGAERLYDAIRGLAAKKPTVAVVGGMAASGAYIAALGTDHIVAQGNSLVGSIGVLFQIPNFATLLDKVGVKVEEVKSAPLKAAPNGFEPTSEAARAALAALVEDSFGWFKALVKERRGLSDAELAAVDDGRVFTGRQGLPLKLVDQLGEERDAIAWLETEKGVTKGLAVRDWRRGRSLERLGFLGAAASAADALGWSGPFALLRRIDAFGAMSVLDGPLALWQAPQPH